VGVPTKTLATSTILATIATIAMLACEKPREKVIDVQTSIAPCRSDDDCELVGPAPPSCCARCSSFAATHARAREILKQCATRGPGGECPALDCECHHDTPICRAGTCAVKSEPCE
jgi:hypothetical protein